VRYIGAKPKLLRWLFRHINRHAQAMGMDPSGIVFLDACTGTASVAVQAMKEGYKVIANDLLCFASHVARAQLCFPAARLPEARLMIDLLNRLNPMEGHFFRQYSSPVDEPYRPGKRRYLTSANAQQIDAARTFIQGVKDPVMQSYLYYCLILGIGRVDNTTGNHAAFLKGWRPEAKRGFTMSAPIVYGEASAVVFNRDVLELLDDPEFRQSHAEDILYIDPPYVPREYAPNYHLYEAAVSATDPVVKGITGLPEDYARSTFCRPVEAVAEFLEKIVRRTRARLIAISYSSDSTVPLQRMMAAMFHGGCETVEVQAEPYQRYKSDSSEERDYRQELLQEFLIIGHKTAPDDLDAFF